MLPVMLEISYKFLWATDPHLVFGSPVRLRSLAFQALDRDLDRSINFQNIKDRRPVLTSQNQDRFWLVTQPVLIDLF